MSRNTKKGHQLALSGQTPVAQSPKLRAQMLAETGKIFLTVKAYREHKLAAGRGAGKQQERSEWTKERIGRRRVS